MRWFAHVKMRAARYTELNIWNLALPGRRKRGTPQRSFTDVVKVDIQRVGRIEEDTRNRVRRRQVISCENPKGAAKRRRACLNISEKADIL